jgi:uncharacterized protein YegP (UPF0339 family)
MAACRTFLAFGIVIACTSLAHAQAQLTVNGTAPPTTVQAAAGSVVSVGVTNGPGNPTDWVGFYLVGAADGSYLDWRYLNGSTVAPASGVTDATISFQVPVAPGDYEFRLFANNGYTRLATSTTLAVRASTAQLAVNGVAPPNSVSAVAGSMASVGVSGGPANPTDWVGLYPAGAADTTFIDWRYLNGSTVPPASGVTDATISFLVPATPGNYEFRLFANNGYARLATSAVVVVVASPAQLTV